MTDRKPSNQRILTLNNFGLAAAALLAVHGAYFTGECVVKKAPPVAYFYGGASAALGLSGSLWFWRKRSKAAPQP